MAKKKKSLAETLTRQEDNAPHLIIIARAGTGKTTTQIEGVKLMKGEEPCITPSPQQQAVWDSLLLSKESASSICCVAFNKSIAIELGQRVPAGVEAMTLHSMGYRAVRDAYPTARLDGNRVSKILEELAGQDIWHLRRCEGVMAKAVEQLVGLCKQNLTDLSAAAYVDHELSQLVAHYDVDLNDCRFKVYDLVPQVLERCKQVDRDNTLDFNDMIWLPIVLDLPVYRYGMLLVDEAQDLNRCQQELAMRAGDRLILCGDPKQAIYGFAGADSESMLRMEKRLTSTDRGVQVLPLTVTRRCGKAIVREAQRYVPDIEAHESNGEGIASRATFKGGKYRSLVADADMLLCRTNAPLIRECLAFLVAGRKAVIRGRDVGQGLISTIKRLCEEGTTEMLIQRLEEWLDKELRKEGAKRSPSDTRIIALSDRHDCIVSLTEGCNTVAEVIERIGKIFAGKYCPECGRVHGEEQTRCSNRDCQTYTIKGQAYPVGPELVTPEGIQLSSVHKAKGLEADRVFILQPPEAPMPHPMAKSPWQRAQEDNLIYVAITRAKKELVYVR